MSKPDGGPDFPIRVNDGISSYMCMTLRDYFAAAALQGLYSGESAENGIFPNAKAAAEAAYASADAMLAERDK